MNIKVNFTHLDKAVEKVRLAHLRRGVRIESVDEGIIAKVRKLLEACPPEDLMELAFSFQVIELAACVTIASLKTNKILTDKACTVIKYRPIHEVLWYGVEKLIQSYPNVPLEAVLRELISDGRFHFDPVPENIPKRIEKWFKSADLARGVLEDYEQHDERELIAFMDSVNIITYRGMCDAVWDELLSEGSKKLLLRQENRRILSKMEEAVETKTLGRWARNYLTALEGLSDWDESILHLIKSRFDIPKFKKNTVEGPFWKDVPIETKERFYHWCIGLQIESFFDGVRAQFWKKFYKKHHIVDVKSILQGGGFMLQFRDFGVVEFKNTGNAAYVYSPEVFEELWARASFKNFAGAFKDKKKTLRTFGLKEGRILHSGDWQETYGQVIQGLIKSTAR